MGVTDDSDTSVHQDSLQQLKMKLLLIVPLSLALLGVVSPLPHEYNESLKVFQKKNHQFHVHVPEAKLAEEAKELQRHQKQINDENRKFEQSKVHFREKVYPFAALTKEEFKKEYTGLKPHQAKGRGLILPSEEVMNCPKNRAKVEKMYKELAKSRDSIPDSYSSVDDGHNTTVRNQGQCGSCAAFSAAGLFETTMLKAGASVSSTDFDLSEQYLLDCAYGSNDANGCNGAGLDSYPDYMANTAGGTVPHENSYGYAGTSPTLTCPSESDAPKWNPGYKVSEAIHDWACTEDKMKILLANKGAVATAVHTENSATFSSYKEGVMDDCVDMSLSTNNVDHAVLAVGYGTSDDGIDYWLVKNSWGSDWGENGYIKIKRGSSCNGIATYCTTVDVDSNGSADDVPAAPVTEVSSTCDLSNLTGWDLTDTSTTYSITWGSIESTIKCTAAEICTVQTSTVSSDKSACQRICGSDTCSF